MKICILSVIVSVCLLVHAESSDQALRGSSHSAAVTSSEELATLTDSIKNLFREEGAARTTKLGARHKAVVSTDDGAASLIKEFLKADATSAPPALVDSASKPTKTRATPAKAAVVATKKPSALLAKLQVPRVKPDVPPSVKPPAALAKPKAAPAKAPVKANAKSAVIGSALVASSSVKPAAVVPSMPTSVLAKSTTAAPSKSATVASATVASMPAMPVSKPAGKLAENPVVKPALVAPIVGRATSTAVASVVVLAHPQLEVRTPTASSPVIAANKTVAPMRPMEPVAATVAVTTVAPVPVNTVAAASATTAVPSLSNEITEQRLAVLNKTHASASLGVNATAIVAAKAGVNASRPPMPEKVIESLPMAGFLVGDDDDKVAAKPTEAPAAKELSTLSPPVASKLAMAPTVAAEQPTAANATPVTSNVTSFHVQRRPRPMPAKASPQLAAKGRAAAAAKSARATKAGEETKTANVPKAPMVRPKLAIHTKAAAKIAEETRAIEAVHERALEVKKQLEKSKELKAMHSRPAHSQLPHQMPAPDWASNLLRPRHAVTAAAADHRHAAGRMPNDRQAPSRVHVALASQATDVALAPEPQVNEYEEFLAQQHETALVSQASTVAVAATPPAPPQPQPQERVEVSTAAPAVESSAASTDPLTLPSMYGQPRIHAPVSMSAAMMSVKHPDVDGTPATSVGSGPVAAFGWVKSFVRRVWDASAEHVWTSGKASPVVAHQAPTVALLDTQTQIDDESIDRTARDTRKDSDQDIVSADAWSQMENGDRR